MNGNGKGENQKVKYPVSFNLKTIMDNSIPKGEHEKNIKSLLLKLGITYKTFSSKLSSNRKYISLTVNVRIEDEKTFGALYEGLKNIPGVKYAL